MKKEYKEVLISIMQPPTVEMLYSSDLANDNWVNEDDLPWGNN